MYYTGIKHDGHLRTQGKFLKRSQTSGVFYLRNRKHVPCFYQVIETRVDVWENKQTFASVSLTQ